MHKVSKFAGTALLLTMALGSAQAQRRMMVEGPPGGGYTLMLPGMLIILSSDEEASEVKVFRRLQFQDELDEEYQGLDLKEGDVIAMADGQPLVKSDDFKKLYEEAEVGAEITLGVRREDEVMVFSFPKPDPASLPQMRIMKGDEADEHGFQTKGDVTIRKEKPKEQKPPR